MREKIFATGLAVLVGASSLGCKSMPTMPRMTWWKTASKSDPESTTLARSAPTKPSELAKQAQGLAAAPATKYAGGEAAPFVPSASAATPNVLAAKGASATYPSTDAPTFTPTTSPNSSLATATPKVSGHLGSLAMPYDPNAVPPAAAATAKSALPAAASAERYAATSTPTSTLPNLSIASAAAAAAQPPQAESRYGNYFSAGQTLATEGLPPASATNSPGNRYAQAATSVSAVVPTTPPTNETAAIPEISAITPPASAVASAAPYRPGGTSTYPGTTVASAALEIATRPNLPASTGSQVPNVTTPHAGEHTPSPPSSQLPRYR